MKFWKKDLLLLFCCESIFREKDVWLNVLLAVKKNDHDWFKLEIVSTKQMLWNKIRILVNNIKEVCSYHCHEKCVCIKEIFKSHNEAQKRQQKSMCICNPYNVTTNNNFPNIGLIKFYGDYNSQPNRQGLAVSPAMLIMEHVKIYVSHSVIIIEGK